MALKVVAFLGQDFSCKVVDTGTCITRVTGELKGKFFDEKRPFTLYYTPVDKNTGNLLSYF